MRIVGSWRCANSGNYAGTWNCANILKVEYSEIFGALKKEKDENAASSVRVTLIMKQQIQ